MTIKKLSLVNNVILAPMAGITNSPYRQIHQHAGASLVYSEMISANGLIRHGKATLDLLRRNASETPFGIQLFGEDPKVLAEATSMVTEHGELLDLNLGCPVKKVVRSGAGCALMQTPLLAGKIISAMRKATTLPFTVKMRSGWSLATINFIEIGKIAEQSGADALIIHPRTRCQGFGGHSNWEHITALKQAVSIPVIGSGDINTPEDALAMQAKTGCDGVMIGRGGYGNPWLICNILRLQRGELAVAPSNQQRLTAIKQHLHLYQTNFGEKKTIREMRKHLCWYSRGLSGAGEFRAKVNKLDNLPELELTIDDFFAGEV